MMKDVCNHIQTVHMQSGRRLWLAAQTLLDKKRPPSPDIVWFCVALTQLLHWVPPQAADFN